MNIPKIQIHLKNRQVFVHVRKMRSTFEKNKIVLKLLVVSLPSNPWTRIYQMGSGHAVARCFENAGASLAYILDDVFGN